MLLLTPPFLYTTNLIQPTTIASSKVGDNKIASCKRDLDQLSNVGSSSACDKPRLSKADAERLEPFFCMAFSPVVEGSVVGPDQAKYSANMEEQRVLYCLKKRTELYGASTSCVDGSLDDMVDHVINFRTRLGNSSEHSQDVSLLLYILLDYHASCSKPAYPVAPKERTPFAEYTIPVFKYFSSSTGLLSFIWCEKSSPANKQLKLCLPEGHTKLLDGIGFSCIDKAERVYVECSGETDGDHTEESCLKLMECSSNCLKNDMNQHQNASWKTFERRQMFSLQAIGSKITLLSTSCLGPKKWCFVEVRSVIVPRSWEDRFYLDSLMELLMKLKELLLEQQEVTVLLKKQQSGFVPVDAQDTVQARCRVNEL